MAALLPDIVELRRLPSPASTPQALAWWQDVLWISSRDAQRLHGVNPRTWEVVAEADTAGICWGGVPVKGTLYFVSGEGPEGDRYLRRYEPDHGFDDAYRVALPELTGSYLSFEGEGIYVSQWYKHRLLQLDLENGNILRTIQVGAEICGHVFVGGLLYALCGTEENGESWHVARLDLRETIPRVEALARMPFACRSLAHDGEHFWTNHRAANETVSFDLPNR